MDLRITQVVNVGCSRNPPVNVAVFIQLTNYLKANLLYVFLSLFLKSVSLYIYHPFVIRGLLVRINWRASTYWGTNV